MKRGETNDSKNARSKNYNERGELLLMPLTEIPTSEMWLYQNKEAMQHVKKGLEDAAEGKISKLNLEEL